MINSKYFNIRHLKRAYKLKNGLHNYKEEILLTIYNLVDSLVHIFIYIYILLYVI